MIRQTSLLTDVAVASGGARNLSELAANLAIALRALDCEEGYVRLWAVAGEAAEEVVRHPAFGEDEPPDCSAVAAASQAGEPLVRCGVTMLPFQLAGERAGVLEFRSIAQFEEEELFETSQIVAARLQALAVSPSVEDSAGSIDSVELASDTQKVVATFAAQAKRLLEHDRLSVYLLTPDGRSLERFAVATSPIIPGEGEVFPLEDAGIARVLTSNTPIVSADLATDARIRGREDSVIADAGFHALLSIPLRIDGHPFGILNFVSHIEGFYNEADLPIAQQMADQVAVFFQNLRLEHSVRLAIQRESIQLERNRLARELHDTLAQSLAEIGFKSERLVEQLADDAEARGLSVELHQASVGAFEEARRALGNLVPAELETHALGEAVQRLLDHLGPDHGIEGTLEITGDVDELPDHVQQGLFRIVQEALTNVRRHSSASRVDLAIRLGREVLLSVEDDGVGFSNEALASGGGFGLRAMRERAEALGGRLIVTSTRERGTTACATIPLGGKAEERTPHQSPPASPRPIIRVLVVDDHPVVRECVSTLLEREGDIRVVGEASGVADAVAAAQRCRPDVVLLDLQLADGSGIEVASAFADGAEQPRVLMLSAFADRERVMCSMAAGAKGFVLKNSNAETIVGAIRAVMHGSVVFDQSSSAELWTGREGQSLTLRELEILRLVAEGLTTLQIAKRVYLSTKSVERIIATVVSKLGAANRTHAVTRAIANGLIDVEGI
jgi:signal transduction histidine kinase/DNA-binding NarL/FixJ family response regulator